jgi:3-oxoacyl-[acyl-carrier protein] reductase
MERKVCLITETSRGRGRIIAESYAEKGAIEYSNASKTGSIDEWLKVSSLKIQTTVSADYLDVKDYVAVKRSVLRTINEQTRTGSIVSNAGVVTYELLGMSQF